MVKVNCLETAKKTYREQLDNESIESVYDALRRHAKNAENENANLVEAMNSFSKELSDVNERANKETMLQQLISLQSIADNLEREELFRKRGYTTDKSVPVSLMAKMTGTSEKAGRNRDNTYSRKMAMADAFYREFARDIQGPLTPLFLSKTGQAELAEAMYAHRRGTPIDSQYGEIAKIIIKYQDRFYDKARALGIDITELEDRIAPNIHDAGRMTSLTSAEKKAARELYPNAGKPEYEFAFQKWNDFMLPLIDHDKVFKARNVDPNNKAQVMQFQRASFDNLVNKGKVSQKNVNFANKFKKSRVYHWLDGESLVAYNSEYGNNAIQDSFVRELAYGFGMLEVIRDWGVNPDVTIDRTLQVMDENPILKQRFDKQEEARKLKNVMRELTARIDDYQGTVPTISNSLKAFEVVTKLGSVLLTSVQDLYSIANVAKQAGRSRFVSYAMTITSPLRGINKKDLALIYKYTNTGISNKLGSTARFEVNPFAPTSANSQATHWAFKLNLLERYDNGNRAYIATSLSRYIADNRHMTWEMLKPKDKEMWESYNIGEDKWEVIRHSNVKIGGRKKEFITPDSVQEMPVDKILEVLKKQGVENPTPTRIQNFRDGIERDLVTYFRDRIDHAIIQPDAYDNSLPIFGGSLENPVMRAVMQNISQFKKFGVAQFRKSVLPILRENGARTKAEMLYGGKSNWKGIAWLMVENMALAYLVATLKNLSQGKTWPGLDKTDTWMKMIKSSLGVLGTGLQIDPKDLTGSLGKILAGPSVSDIGKLLKLGYYGVTETAKGKGYKNTKKSFYQFIKGNIPYNTFMTQWLMNHMFLDALEDSAYPGKRARDLRHLEQNTGAKQLF